MTPKIELRNSSGVPLVRFRGVHLDPHEQFTYDVADGVTQALQQVPHGEISVTAYRVSDARVLGALAMATFFTSDTHFGEAYVIES